MHPFTVFIVALSATALALPRPQLGGSLTNTILNGIGDLLGTDDRYHTTERCYSRNSADLSSCISACVQAQCVEGSAECGACIRGCSSSLAACDDHPRSSGTGGTGQANSTSTTTHAN